MFRKTRVYRGFILPVLVDLLKFFLWVMEPFLPDDTIEDAEELIALHHGPHMRLPVRIQRIARKLEPERQEKLMEIAQSLQENQEAQAELKEEFGG